MIKKNGSGVVAASIALLAVLAAQPSYAQDKAKGNDNGGGGGKSSSVKADRNGPSGGKSAASDRGGPADAEPRGNGKEARGTESARGNSDRDVLAIGREDKARNDRGSGNSAKGKQGPDGDMRGGPKRNAGGLDRIDGRDGFAFRVVRETFGSRPRLIDGCPPGLAKKRNGCLPPGQAKNRYRSFEPGFFGLFGAERGQYLYQDGYLLRYRPDGLAGFLPLLGGALGLGNTWPSSYGYAPLPTYYSDYFQLGDSGSYRYADNVIYRINPETAAITSIAGLLTGNDFAIGQPMPRGYDVYNVPFDQRDRYADSPEARYRYADGYVYQIDPATALVTAAIALAL